MCVATAKCQLDKDKTDRRRDPLRCQAPEGGAPSQTELLAIYWSGPETV